MNGKWTEKCVFERERETQTYVQIQLYTHTQTHTICGSNEVVCRNIWNAYLGERLWTVN